MTDSISPLRFCLNKNIPVFCFRFAQTHWKIMIPRRTTFTMPKTAPITGVVKDVSEEEVSFPSSRKTHAFLLFAFLIGIA